MEVTGLVLNIGELTKQRAIDSIKAQTHQLTEIVEVSNITPFHQAINKGISRINTEFFIQCDADMILDLDCVEVMLKHITNKIAVVAAYLDDPILGKIQAVKLFRTECFQYVKFPNHISPDTECLLQLTKNGWGYTFAKRAEFQFNHPVDVLGEHKPNYSLHYTFHKFFLEGCRIRSRGVFKEFALCLERLRHSQHPMASVALVAFAHGFFDDTKEDGLIPYKTSKAFHIYSDFMKSHQSDNEDFSITG